MRVASINPNMIVAIVNNSDIGFGIGRMWETMVDESNWQTMIFRSIEEAESWLKERMHQVHSIKINLI